MARRIHELAREWGVESKELLARLGKIGIVGKRSQGSLTEEQIKQVRRELRIGEKRDVVIGRERIVTGVTGQRIVERRVGSTVIRRRRSVAAGPIPEIDVNSPISIFRDEAVAVEPFTVSEPLPQLTDTESVLPLSEFPEPPVEIPPESEPAEMIGGDGPGAEAGLLEERQPIPLPASAEAESSAPVQSPSAVPASVDFGKPSVAAESRVAAGSVRRVAGPRVVGRIDLKKAEAERTAALGRAAGGPAARSRRGPSAAPQPPPALAPGRGTPGRRKKRRVVRKVDISETGGRETRMRVPRKKRAQPGKEQRKTELTTPKASKRIVRISEVVSVGELAKAIGVKAAAVVKKLMESGMMASVNQVLDVDTATLIASEFGYNVENVSFDVDSAIEVGHGVADEGALQPRPPVVTIMGHVDHGKTSLLDAIRESRVTAGEAGGITQHIGAYCVEVESRRVTFLDTPGHEAFTAMRARGAKVTDIVILVVAADDGVMPQTIEAINHARAAQVPIVVAINKIDKAEANLDRIKQGLSEQGLVPEDWGGETICVPVSAKTREGLPQLLEMLLLQAEILELKANPDTLARGTIIEAKLDRGRGPVATVLVQEGILRVGNPFVCGAHYGRARAMISQSGEKVDTAGPSTPVEILGFGAVPEAGIPFVAVADEATARQVAEHRGQKEREASLRKSAKVSLEDLYRQIQAGDTKELRVVVKADVQGSVEAISEALARLSTEEVRLNVLHSSVGGIRETDVMLASASNAIVVGFNVRPETNANTTAESEGVEIRLYTVIYDAVNEIRDAMEGLLDPTYREKVQGHAQVREVFSIPGVGTIAGCMVSDGTIRRNGRARLVRDQVVVYDGKVNSLRRFKEDAREVHRGYECGIGLESYQDIKTGDVIESYEMEELVAHLGAPKARPSAAPRVGG